MANVPETSTFDSGVYQWETTDPVQGGVDGVDNRPLKNLANRTRYLKDHMDAAETAITAKAPINSPTFTGTPSAPTPAAGDASTAVATTAFMTALNSGIATVNVAGNSNVTLTAAQYGCGIVVLSGALTGNINVIFPAGGRWVVANQSSGAYTITCKTAGGSGVAVAQGASLPVMGDGTNIKKQQTDFTDAVLLGSPTATTPPGSDSSTRVATTAFIQALLASLSSVPSGTVMAYAGSTAPAGWLVCDGAQYSQTTYAALYAVVGSTFGTAVSGNFRVPNMSGLFIRGWNNGQGGMPDAGRTFGSAQGDAIKTHKHVIPFQDDYNGGQHPYGETSTQVQVGGINVNHSHGYAFTNDGSATSANSGDNPNPSTTITTETRPANIALLYIIKT